METESTKMTHLQWALYNHNHPECSLYYDFPVISQQKSYFIWNFSLQICLLFQFNKSSLIVWAWKKKTVNESSSLKLRSAPLTNNKMHYKPFIKQFSFIIKLKLIYKNLDRCLVYFFHMLVNSNFIYDAYYKL